MPGTVLDDSCAPSNPYYLYFKDECTEAGKPESYQRWGQESPLVPWTGLHRLKQPVFNQWPPATDSRKYSKHHKTWEMWRVRFRLPKTLLSKFSFTQTFPVSPGVHRQLSMLTQRSTAQKHFRHTPSSHAGEKRQRGSVRCLTQPTQHSPCFLPRTGPFVSSYPFS